MSCEHDTDLLTGSCITEYGEGWFKVEPACATLPVKCSHGVHIPEDERTTGKSSYCGVCNPATYSGDDILHRTLQKKKVSYREQPEARTMDAAEFLEQPLSARLARAQEFTAL